MGMVNWNPDIMALWEAPVNFHSSEINIDIAPISVRHKTSLYKVHFLFLMLGLHVLYVAKKGILLGVITREEMIKKKV